MIKSWHPWCIGLALLGVASAALSMDIEKIESRYRDKKYTLTLIAVVNAPSTRVQEVLRDYPRYPRLDPRILESRVLSRSGLHDAVLYTVLRACFGVFCRNVKRVERIAESDNELRASVLPEQSEVTSGETHTQLTALNGKTRIAYTTSIAPGFWIPSIVGRPLMLRTLKEASVDLFRHVEQEAQSQPVSHQ